MLEYILGLLAQVAQSIQGVLAGINGALSALTTTVAQWVGELVANVVGQMRSILAGLADTIRSIVAGVLDGITAYIGPMIQAVTSIVEEVRGFFVDILSRLRTVVVTLWETITARIAEAMEYLSRLFSDVVSYVRALFQETVAQVRGIVSGVVEWVAALVSQGIQAIATVVNNVLGVIQGGVAWVFDQVSRVVQRVVDTVSAVWQQLVTGAEAIIRSIDQRLQDVRQGMADIATDMVRSLADLTAEQVKSFREAAESIINKLLEYMPAETVYADAKRVQEATPEITGMQLSHHAFNQLWARLTPSSPVGLILFGALFSVAWGIQAYSGIGQSFSDIIVQEWAAKFHPTILSQSDTVAAWRRGSLTEADAVANLERHGYKPENGRVLLRSAEGAPAPFELASMKRRGIIQEDDLKHGLQQAGLGAEWHARFMEYTQIIPPAADLIHMAVREAFSKDVAERFGQYEDFPQEFATWAEKQGLSREWCERYWAAHWSLPSPQQGFEMLHRKVKTRDGSEFSYADLDLLLRALDVMPFWREPLVQIAYRPYTRVDIRRMHKVGVLGDDELMKAYTDLGYDDEHAANLAEFTQRLNAPAKAETSDELGTLTRSTIVRFYRDGLLDRMRAMSLLQDLGISPEASALYLNAADLAEAQEERQDTLELITQRALMGLITDQQALAEARAAGLTETEVLKLQARLEREAAKRYKIPSRSEGERMFVLGIITEQAYGGLLRVLGYADAWIPGYIALAKHRIKEGKEEA